jgi:DNA polymerase-1
MVKIFDTALLDETVLTPDEQHWLYNGLDNCITLEVFEELSRTIDDTARRTYEFSLALQAPVLEMNMRGVLVNQNRRREVIRDFERKQAQLEYQLMTLLGGVFDLRQFNWASPKQVKDLLYETMRLPVQKKRNANGIFAPSTDREALEALSLYYIAEPVINHILGLRDLGKSLGFLRTPLDSDGRLRTSFNIAGTVTGRFSSSADDFDVGTNLQNITESLRSIFVADPGYKFANLDLEQGDSRNVGAICWNLFVEERGEKFAGGYLDACESGDLHTYVTRLVQPDLPWGEASDREVAERKFYRHLSYRDGSKRLGHGSNYLGKPAHMAKQTKFPVADVKRFQEEYFRAFPCIPAWHKNVFWKLSNLGYLETLFGDRRVFFGRPEEDSTRREAVAHAPQSMTGKEINIGILNLWRANRVQLLIQVHDSILFQFPEERESEIIPWALEALQAPLVLAKDRPFVVPTEAKVGWTWGNASDSNPDGLIKWKGSDPRSRVERKFRPSILA